MAVRLPTLEQIDNLGSSFGLVLTPDEVAAFQQAFKGPLTSYGRLDELVPPALAPIAPRSPGYRPPASENPYGAWYWKTNIHAGGEGLLSGKKIAIKDNICVAGVPMMNGSVLLEGYVPEIDATVVTRILEAGGTIAGKAACEDLCFSGASHTCATGVIRNPHNPAHSAGGSSGGSAAPGRSRRCADGAWRRPGRIDPHAVKLVRYLWLEADLGIGAHYRLDADQLFRRPLRPDGRVG